jgi:predicted Zn-dependent protease
VITLHGDLFDGEVPRARAVEITVDGDDVRIVGEEIAPMTLARASIAPDLPVTGVARRLQLPGGGVVETTDDAAVAAAWPPRPSFGRLGDVLEHYWAATLAAAALGVTVLWLVVAYALPAAADPVARSISPEIERAIGRHTLATVDQLYAKPTRLDTGQRRHVRSLVTELMRGEDAVSPWRLEFREMGGPNAFALPGNTIVVTDELVTFARNDDELLAVIAHEIGHLRERHATRLVLQQSGIAVLATAVAGDAVGMTFLAAALPAMLLDAQYSRAFEEEADAAAIEQLRRHGRSPSAFADVMRRFAADPRTSEPDDPLFRYLSTHPATEERIRRAEEAAARAPAPPR